MGAGAFGMCVGDPFSLCPWDAIPWTFHGLSQGAERTEDAPDAQNSEIWGGAVVFHLLQWETGDSQTSLLFPARPEALGVEKSKALVPGGFSGWEVGLGCSALAQRWVLHPSGGGG